MSLCLSSHLCYLSPPLLPYLSISPTHNLFHYVSLIPSLSLSNSLSPSLPFFPLYLSFLSFSVNFSPKSSSWCSDARFSCSQCSRSVFRFLIRDVKTLAVAPACSTSPWLQSEMQMNMYVGIWPLRAFTGYSRSLCRFGRVLLECVCLFIICPLLSRLLVHPPGCVQGPLWRWLFWPRQPGNRQPAAAAAAAHTLTLLICMCALWATGEGFATLHRNFLWIHASLCVCEHGERGHRWDRMDFSSSSLSLCWNSSALGGTLTLAVCWQAEAPIDHFSHCKQTNVLRVASPAFLPIIPRNTSEQATDSGAQTAKTGPIILHFPAEVCFVLIKLRHNIYKINHIKNIY